MRALNILLVVGLLASVPSCASPSGTTPTVSERHSAPDEAFKEFVPTLGGYQNNAFVRAGMIGPDNKETTVFWRTDQPGAMLVARLGGGFFRGSGGPGSLEVGPAGEKICFGTMRVAIDGESQFTGNLDYDGSTYTVIGKVKLLKYTFESSEKNPLVLKLVKDRGLVYVNGEGVVKTPAGDRIRFGAAAS